MQNVDYIAEDGRESATSDDSNGRHRISTPEILNTEYDDRINELEQQHSSIIMELETSKVQY
jgi:hypothetical protein